MVKRIALQVLGVIFGVLTVAGVAQAAAPTISGYELTTKRGGGWWYDSDGAITVKVKTDGANYTTVCDYSSLPPFGTEKKVTATNNGDNTYTCTFTPSNTGTMGGGVVVLTATNTSGETTINAPTMPSSPNEMPDTTKSPMLMLNINPKNMTPPGDKNNMSFGPETTDFSTITDFKKATLTFQMRIDGVDRFKITFKDQDMTDMATLRNMFTIFHLMESAAAGEFKFDPNAQSALDKANAAVTIYGLKDKYTSTPDILVDGIYDPAAAKGVSFDVAAGTVTFTAAHFSTFEAVPKITDVTPADKTAADSDSAEVKGKVNDKSSTVKIKVGDTDQGTITVASDGSFSKTVKLAVGNNTVKVDASNNIGSAVTVSRTLVRNPSLTVSAPEDKTTTSDKEVTIKGKTDDSSVTVTIKVGETDQGTVTVSSDGSFEKKVALTTGSNTLTVTAKKGDGSKTVSRSVTRQTLPATGTNTVVAAALLAILGLGIILRMATKQRAR